MIQIYILGGHRTILHFDGDGFSNLREFLANTDPTNLEDKPPCWADYDLDDDVDRIDLAIFASEFVPRDCLGRNHCKCDLDFDDMVNELDVRFFSKDYGLFDCLRR